MYIVCAKYFLNSTAVIINLFMGLFIISNSKESSDLVNVCFTL